MIRKCDLAENVIVCSSNSVNYNPDAVLFLMVLVYCARELFISPCNLADASFPMEGLVTLEN